MMGPIIVTVKKNLTISTKRESFEFEGVSQEAAPSTFFPTTLEMVFSSDTCLWNRGLLSLIPWI
jgi:hypothetical protein